MSLPRGFLEALGDVPVITEGSELRRKSRDNFWYSPVLRRLFENVIADAVVRPRDEQDVLRVAAACHRYDLALTPRGGGTANYGQCMPIHGGVVLDLGGLDELRWIGNGSYRAQAGIRMGDLEVALQAQGQELRMFPSTRDTATLGGFIAGGSGGIGSITWGMLRERGNILGARIVTVEQEPRVLELRGAEVACIAHAYGTTGILTEIELPSAPAYDWVDAVLVFDEFLAAAHFGQSLAEAAAIVKKLCSVLAAPIAQTYLKPIRELVPAGKTCVLTCVAAQSWEATLQLAVEHGATLVYRRTAAELRSEKRLPLFMMSWNHTTLWALRADPKLTYLQTAFPPAGTPEQRFALVEKLMAHFGDEVLMHLEFIRSGAGYSFAAIQLLRFTTEARLQEIMAYHEQLGCRQFNPHAFTVEEGGMKQIDHTQVDYKRVVDPKGLLNPGKLLGWSDPNWKQAS